MRHDTLSPSGIRKDQFHRGSQAKERPVESLNINGIILSAFTSPHRLWANPYTSTYATHIDEQDWVTLRKAPFPFNIVGSNSSLYERLCLRPLFLNYSKNKAGFTAIKWFPDFRRLMSTTTSGELSVFSSDTCMLEDIKRLPSSAGALTALEWLPNESAVLTGAWGGSVHLSSPTLSPMGILRDLLGHSIIDISASPSSIKVAATAADAHPAIWDINQQAKESSLSALGFDITSLQWHPQQGLIATGSKSDQLTFWDPRVAAPLKTILAHKGSITALRFSPNGTWLATAGRDSLIRIWDLQTLNCFKQFRFSADADARVTVLSWSPGIASRLLVSGDSSGTITHFDLTLTGQSFNSITRQLPPLLHQSPILSICQSAHHESCPVTALDFHSTGRSLASCGLDGSVRIWVPPLFDSSTPVIQHCVPAPQATARSGGHYHLTQHSVK